MSEAVVIVASTRGASGETHDTTGPILATFLRDLGLTTADPVVVADGEPVRAALVEAIASDARLVITTGGTGITPTDSTPEMTKPLLDKEITGIPEALRAAGVAQGVPTAVLSRGLAGLAGRCLIINLPGSRGAVRDAIKVLGPLLPHALDQVRGSDH